jgi:hypothetical protein
MKKTSILIVTLLMALTLASCNNTDNVTKPDHKDPVNDGEQQVEVKKPEEQKPDEVTEDTTDNQAKERPVTKTDHIGIEGMEEEFQFELVDASNMGFTTYIPEDMIAELNSTAEGDSFTAYTNFEGKKNENAFIRIFKPSPSSATTVEELITFTKEQLTSQGFDVPGRMSDEHKYFSFSELEMSTVKKEGQDMSLMSNISIFKRGDQVFRIQLLYPEEYSEGFMPRAFKLVDDIVWDVK